jgi:hypothetical protein
MIVSASERRPWLAHVRASLALFRERASQQRPLSLVRWTTSRRLARAKLRYRFVGRKRACGASRAARLKVWVSSRGELHPPATHPARGYASRTRSQRFRLSGCSLPGSRIVTVIEGRATGGGSRLLRRPSDGVSRIWPVVASVGHVMQPGTSGATCARASTRSRPARSGQPECSRCSSSTSRTTRSCSDSPRQARISR